MTTGPDRCGWLESLMDAIGVIPTYILIFLVGPFVIGYVLFLL